MTSTTRGRAKRSPVSSVSPWIELSTSDSLICLHCLQTHGFNVFIDRRDGSITTKARDPPETMGNVEPIYGIFGIVQIVGGPALIAIDGVEAVGGLKQKHTVFKITSTITVPFFEGKRLSENETLANERVQMMLAELTSSGSLYFSPTYDLTNTVQQQSKMFSSDGYVPKMYEVADSRFYFNRFAHTPLLADDKLQQLIVPCIMGFVHIESLNVSGHPCQYALISRRSTARAGTRFFKRGIDDEGHVANYIETEQILCTIQKTSSFVQIRGSIPLFWTQFPNFKYKPAFVISNTRNHSSAARRHFSDLAFRYGDISALSLLSKKGSEAALARRYEALALSMRIETSLQYLSFDFHKECRGLKWDSLSMLMEQLAHACQAHGFCVIEDDRDEVNGGENAPVRASTSVRQNRHHGRRNPLRRDRLRRTPSPSKITHETGLARTTRSHARSKSTSYIDVNGLMHKKLPNDGLAIEIPPSHAQAGVLDAASKAYRTSPNSPTFANVTQGGRQLSAGPLAPPPTSFTTAHRRTHSRENSAADGHDQSFFASYGDLVSSPEEASTARENGHAHAHTNANLQKTPRQPSIALTSSAVATHEIEHGFSDGTADTAFADDDDDGEDIFRRGQPGNSSKAIGLDVQSSRNFSADLDAVHTSGSGTLSSRHGATSGNGPRSPTRIDSSHRIFGTIDESDDEFQAFDHRPGHDRAGFQSQTELLKRHGDGGTLVEPRLNFGNAHAHGMSNASLTAQTSVGPNADIASHGARCHQQQSQHQYQHHHRALSRSSSGMDGVAHVDTSIGGNGFLNDVPVVNGDVLREQTGVIRTNCIDCLDRTNVVQTMVAKRMFIEQCVSLGVLRRSDIQRSQSYQKISGIAGKVDAPSSSALPTSLAPASKSRHRASPSGASKLLQAIPALATALPKLAKSFSPFHRNKGARKMPKSPTIAPKRPHLSHGGSTGQGDWGTENFAHTAALSRNTSHPSSTATATTFGTSANLGYPEASHHHAGATHVGEQQQHHHLAHEVASATTTTTALDLATAVTVGDAGAELTLEDVLPSFYRRFRIIWANHADSCSLQYAGSVALKSDFTRYGKRTIRGLVNDGVAALRRYLFNNLFDGQRQDAYDILLGHLNLCDSAVVDAIATGNYLHRHSSAGMAFFSLPFVVLGAVCLLIISLLVPLFDVDSQRRMTIVLAMILVFSLWVVLRKYYLFVSVPTLFEDDFGQHLITVDDFVHPKRMPVSKLEGVSIVPPIPSPQTPTDKSN